MLFGFVLVFLVLDFFFTLVCTNSCTSNLLIFIDAYYPMVWIHHNALFLCPIDLQVLILPRRCWNKHFKNTTHIWKSIFTAKPFKWWFRGYLVLWGPETIHRLYKNKTISLILRHDLPFAFSSSPECRGEFSRH